MGVSENFSQMDGRIPDTENSVIGGITLKSPLKPILTKSREKKEDDDRVQEGVVEEEEEGFKTPTSAESRIPTLLPCPPAPKKRKPSSPICNNFSEVKDFFNSPEFETFLKRHFHSS